MSDRYWAVVTTHNRHAELEQLLAGLRANEIPVHQIVVIDNASDMPVRSDLGITLVRDGEQPPNLSRLWNVGLDYVADQARGDDYVVAVLNDDLLVPPDLMRKLTAAMDRTGAALAYPNQFGHAAEILHVAPAPVDLTTRIVGFCFALRGSAEVRADERLRWWYGDDHIDWTARMRGGAVMVADVTVTHLHPNENTHTRPELAQQAGLDRGTFAAIWGRTPW